MPQTDEMYEAGARGDAVEEEANEEEDISIIEGTVVIQLFGEYDKQKFFNARKREADRLLKNGTFEALGHGHVPQNTSIFGSELRYELKRAGQCLKRKSRLLTQGYNDVEATLTTKKAPTLQRSSKRLVMAPPLL